jgi:hypothetical protein
MAHTVRVAAIQAAKRSVPYTYGRPRRLSRDRYALTAHCCVPQSGGLVNEARRDGSRPGRQPTVVPS